MSNLLKLVHQVNRLSCTRISTNFWHDFDFGFGSEKEIYAKPTEREQNIKNVRSVASIENKSRELLENLIKSQSIRVSLIHLERLVFYLKKHQLARERVRGDNGMYITLFMSLLSFILKM